jgi:hypothetical protein
MLFTTHFLLLSLAPLGGAPATSNGGVTAPTPPALPGAVTFGPSLHWGDYDGDGALDVFVATPGGPDRLYRGEAGGLVDVTKLAGLEGSAGTRSVVWFDHDQDGDLDLFTASDRAPSRLWSNDGAGLFLDATRAAGLAGEAPDLLVQTLDFDGDGRLDLQRRTAAGDRLFRNLGDGGFEELQLADLLPGLAAPLAPPALDDARRAGPPAGIDAGERGGTQAATSAAGPGAATATNAGAQQAAGAGLVCAGSVEDISNPGICVPLSTVPTLGMIYPLGLDLNIDGAGQVGMGTTTPGAKLDVVGDVRAERIFSTAVGQAPFSVASSVRVDQLNADLLDGQSSAAFTQLGQSISGSEIDDLTVAAVDIKDEAVQTAKLASSAVTSAKLAANAVQSLHIFPDTITSVDLAAGAVLSDEIQDGTILDVDVNPLAGIAGTKIAAAFGAQTVTADGAATSPAMHGAGTFGPTDGFLGVQGTADFDGITGLSLTGQELGVVGISAGSSVSDNVGVLGYSNNIGVRGQGEAIGVNGYTSATAGYGVYGETSASDGWTYGVHGVVSAAGGVGTGVHGSAEFYGTSGSCTGNGVGILGFADNGGIGAYGRGDTGVLGDSQNGTAGTGVAGYAVGTSGVGVQGRTLSSTGVTVGVEGEAESTSGLGVFGHADAATGLTYGVLGQSESTSGRGVRGEALATAGTNYGVQGRTHSASGWGVISYGASGATGQKNFIQPHPSDPSLEIHFYSLEGNESGTYFRGSEQLAEGLRVIEVPEEFRLVSSPEGLSVQLTAVGAPALLWVESKSLDAIVVRGNADVAFDYTVNGVRRGFEEVEFFATNQGFVPELRGEEFGTQYPEAYRRILVENGILNPDFTPNELTAELLGWELQDRRAPVESPAAAAHERARAYEVPPAGRASVTPAEEK